MFIDPKDAKFDSVDLAVLIAKTLSKVNATNPHRNRWSKTGEIFDLTELIEPLIRANTVPVGVTEGLAYALRKDHIPFRHDYVKDEKECSACQALAAHDKWKRDTEIKKIESRNAAW